MQFAKIIAYNYNDDDDDDDCDSDYDDDDNAAANSLGNISIALPGPTTTDGQYG